MCLPTNSKGRKLLVEPHYGLHTAGSCHCSGWPSRWPRSKPQALTLSTIQLWTSFICEILLMTALWCLALGDGRSVDNHLAICNSIITSFGDKSRWRSSVVSPPPICTGITRLSVCDSHNSLEITRESLFNFGTNIRLKEKLPELWRTVIAILTKHIFSCLSKNSYGHYNFTQLMEWGTYFRFGCKMNC